MNSQIFDRKVSQLLPPEDTKCEFCQEIWRGTTPFEVAHAYDCSQRIVLESEAFIVFPAVTPIAPGHLLLVPKHHEYSFQALSPDLLSEVNFLIKTASDVLLPLAPHLLLFEHGVPNCNHAACGINHAHLHLIPYFADAFTRLHMLVDERFSECAETKTDHLPLTGERPISEYLLFGQLGAGFSQLLKESFPSQSLRNIVASAINKKTADWRDFGNSVDFNATLALFN